MDVSSQIYIAAEAIVGVLSFVGNLLVVIAIIKNYQLHTVTNIFIASLATADMLVGLVVAPLAAVSFVGWPDNFLGCTFTNSIVLAFTQVSIFNLLAVAIERFFAIKHPFSYQKNMTIRRAVGINIMVWCIGLLFGLLPVFGWNLSDQKTDDWTCNFVTVIDMEYVVYFHFLGCIIVPLILIMAIYFYIFLIVRKQMSQIAALEISAPHQRTSSKFKKEIKAAKSLAIVIILFAISWIPIHVLNSMSLLCGESCPYPYQLLLVTIVLSHANSAMNPFLYAYGNSHFKSAFKKMFCRHYMEDRDNSTFIPSSRTLPQKNGNGHLNNRTTSTILAPQDLGKFNQRGDNPAVNINPGVDNQGVDNPRRDNQGLDYPGADNNEKTISSEINGDVGFQTDERNGTPNSNTDSNNSSKHVKMQIYTVDDVVRL